MSPSMAPISSPYLGDDKLVNLKANSSMEGEDDASTGRQLGEPKRSPHMCNRCSKPRGTPRRSRAVFYEFTLQEPELSHLGYLINR